MRICGFAGEGLRNERRIHETFPVKELQDYWSSRPRYEDVNPKSNKEFRSGSLLSNKSDRDNGGGEDPGGEGQTYQEWLALQREEKEEVPPPPYTLEFDESNPPQTITNTDIRSSTVATTAVANVQPPVSSAARPAVDTNTYLASHAASSSHTVPSSSIPAASPPAVNVNAYPTSAAPAPRQEAYPQVNAQSPHPSYPPTQGYSPGGVHHPQSVSPSQGHSSQPYSPGVSHPQSHLQSHSHSPQPYPGAASGQPVQSYPPQTGPQQQQPYQGQILQPYPPTSGQAPVWGQQPQPYPPAGGPSYQGYPTSTGYSQGYPPVGAPSQGYISPVAQSYPSSGGPVHQGYPPVDAQGYPSNHNTCQIHNQSQNSVAALANEFGRQSISNPSGVSSGGRLPSPPPLHPSRPARLPSVSLKPNSPSGASSSGNLPTPPPLHPAHPNYPMRPSSSPLKPSSPSNLPNRPHSQTGHHHAGASPPVPSSSGQVTSTPATSTNRPRWPPVEWDSDTPPVQQFPGHRPSGHSHVGATLTRPQTVGASSSNVTGGSTLRPTSSLSTRPSRPDTNMPSSTYISEPTPHTQGHSDDNANPFPFPTGPAKYEQYVTFPSGPLYNSYMPSGYPEQQGGMTYGSWPESGSPPTFPVSSMAYGGPSSYGSGIESQYPGGPTFPSTTSGGGERLHFPEGPGGSYFDASSSSSSSSSYPAPWNSNSGPPMQSRK